MSFDISMEFLGLNEMQKEIERLSTESELKALNKKIIKRAGEIGLQEAEGQIRKKAYSSNPMKSGRKGSRTGQHAADNVALIFSWNEKPTEVFTYIIPTAGGVFGAAVIWYLKAVQLENGIKIQLGMIKKLIDLGEENPAEEIKERTIQKMKDKTEALIDEALEPTEIQNF